MKRRVQVLLFALSAVAVAASHAFGSPATRPGRSGVVVIDTDLALQGGAAAGTGMVLTPSGEILTNNHVIRGATSIRVIVPGTGRHYSATVVGYDATHDVAVLQATGASGMKTVSVGDSSTLKLGQRVTAIGNANGTGRLVLASGRILSRSRTITISDDEGGSERLSHLIEASAALVPGDSGGPLETSTGRVVAMDTAASVGSGVRVTAIGPGFAIPVNRALAIVHQIEGSRSSSTVHIGATAFLGVTIGPGVVIAGILNGGAADAAGLEPGDTITAIDGHTVGSANRLTTLLFPRHPGDQISVGYTDRFGSSHTAALTLGSGPPQ